MDAHVLCMTAGSMRVWIGPVDLVVIFKSMSETLR